MNVFYNNISNPYTAGPPIQEGPDFFGRQDALQWVTSELRNRISNRLVLFGQRRIGKTTLLFQLKQILPADEFLQVYFDLQNYAKDPLGELLADLADDLAKAAGMEPVEPDKFDDRGRFFINQFLPQFRAALGTRRPILLLDEFDVLDQVAAQALSDTIAAKSFFPWLSRLDTKAPWVVCILTLGRQANNIKNFDAIAKSSLRKELWVLDRQSAEDLIRQAEDQGRLSFTNEAIIRILDLTNGHPYFTQLLCQRIWQNAYRDHPSTAPQIDVAKVESAIPDALETGQLALEWIWNGLSIPERIYASALAQIATATQPIEEEDVLKKLVTEARRLYTHEVQAALPYLLERRILDYADKEKRQYRFAIEIFRLWVEKHQPLDRVKNELDQLNRSAEKLFERGKNFFDRGQWHRADRYFRDALEEYPDHFQARLLLGETLLKLERFDDAVEELDKAYEQDREATRATFSRALLEQARAYEKMGRETKAEISYARVIEIFPEWKELIAEQEYPSLDRVKNELDELNALAENLFESGKSFFERRQWDRAERYFGDALEEYPDHFQARLLLGKTLLELKRFDDAVEELEKAYEQGRDESKETLSRALLLRARAHEEAGDETEAKKSYARAIEISPEWKESIGKQEYPYPKTAFIRINVILARRGDAALKRGEFHVARKAYAAIGDESKLAEVDRQVRQKEERAQKQEQEKQWAPAFKLYEDLIQNDPDNSEKLESWIISLERCRTALISSLESRAKAHEENRRWEVASHLYRQLVDLAIDEQSKNVWQKALERSREQAEAAKRSLKKLKAREAQAKSYEEDHEWEKAIAEYEALIRLARDEESKSTWQAALERVNYQIYIIKIKSRLNTSLEALTEGNHEQRMKAVAELSELSNPQAVDSLLEALEQNAPPTWWRRLLPGSQEREKAEMREAIAKALGQIGDPRAVEPLVAQLEDPEPKSRVAAADVLGQIGDQSASEALTKALSDSVAKVREAARQALEQITSSEVIDPLEVEPWIAETLGVESETLYQLIHEAPDDTLPLDDIRHASTRTRTLPPISDEIDDLLSDVVVDVQLDLPAEPVFVGEEFEIAVSLRSGGRGEGRFHSLSIPKERLMGGEINLFLEPQGLQVKGGKEDSLPLMAEASTSGASGRQIEPQALFTVSASRPGAVEIKVDLYFEESFQESLVGQVEVEAADLGIIERRITPRPVPQPDLMLQVVSEWKDDRSAVRFRYRLDGFRGASFKMDGLSSPWLAVGWLEQVRGLLELTVERMNLGMISDARARLESFGRSLYRHVLDIELQTLFKQARQRHTLLIVADQDAWLPWELLHDGRGFLGERFLIGRWPRESDDSRPYEFPIGPVNVAHYRTIKDEEAEMWAQLLKQPFEPLPPEILTGGVLDLKHIDQLRGLHLIRRAQLEQRNLPVPMKEHVPTQEETIVEEVRTSRLSLRRNRPLVTLSYLSTGQPELTQLAQSWAPTYINAGCSAFIGPLWAVDEAVEAAFISTFYAELWKGASLGEAFRRAQKMARVAVLERVDWLAYILFGDPMARPYRPVEGDGYAVVEPVGRQIEEPIFPGESVRFRVSLRRTPPVWHENRVVEVAQELDFDDLQVHVMARDVTILPKAVIVMQRTPTKDYLGWFTLLMPTQMKRKKTGVQVFFVDGEKPIHTLTIPLKVGKGKKESR